MHESAGQSRSVTQRLPSVGGRAASVGVEEALGATAAEAAGRGQPEQEQGKEHRAAVAGGRQWEGAPHGGKDTRQAGLADPSRRRFRGRDGRVVRAAPK